LPIDTHHVLKFCKDSFKGADGINSKTHHLQKTDAIVI